MRINKISVTKLFGVFNHIIPLNREEGITIIHGPNGFGKTVVLRMVNGFFNSRYSELRTIPFTELRLDFNDGSHVEVTKSIDQTNENEKDEKLTFHFYHPGAEPQNFSPDLLTNSGVKMNWHLSATEDEVNSLIQFGDQNIVTPLGPLENITMPFIKSFEKFARRLKKEPKWLSELGSAFM